MEQLLMNSTSSQTFRKKRCVGYARVSTQEQAEEGYSIDAQIQTIQEYCQRENMECVGVYVDRGKSGKNIKAARRCSNFFMMPRMETSML